MTTLDSRSEAGLWLVPATATVVRLSGELDLATGRPLRERLLRALRHSTALLILDLSGVSICAAAGLGVMVDAQRQARSLNITLGLAAPRPHVAKVLCATGLDLVFPVYGTTPTPTGRAASGTAAPR
ncbi:STAS domain-containing protein [Nonomuraea sp. M3C6]|uniref:Anti-sigma factor antagonist n=1 Tax=Nonomuraea marmarensis TaxID=3351344 RepID=A0ABW7AP90_9ACTN